MIKPFGIFLILFTIMHCPLMAAAQQPQSFVGERTVAQWRILAAEDFYAIGYASGVLAATAPLMTCPHIFTVGELVAYLRYTAPPQDNITNASWSFYEARGCTLSEDVRTLIRQGRSR